MKIDINADLGESFGAYLIGNDELIFPFLSSCNIACGFHGGDPLHIEKTILRAKRLGVRIGAHPSYPDRQGFGRRDMELSDEELGALVRYQVAALYQLCQCHDVVLKYVKPHGALYNRAARDPQVAKVVVEAIRSVNSELAIMSLPNGEVEKLTEGPFITEAFIDRKYTREGRLASRKLSGAVIHDPEEAVEQVLGLLLEGKIRTIDGAFLEMPQFHLKSAGTNTQLSLCIHGDNPAALAILKALDKAFEKEGIQKSSS